jgi:hypothetical protein
MLRSLLFLFDTGETWWTYANNTWAALSEEQSGMTKAALEAISTDAWSQKAITAS